jgi:hypothetical protein
MLLSGKRWALFGVLVALVASTAGGREDEPPLKGDAIKVAAVKPAAPAVLKQGEKMEVEFRYSVESAEEVVIFVRPYTKGERTPGYTAHPSLGYEKGKGKDVGWFLFNRPAVVDEVRVRMLDAKTRKVLVEFKYQIKAEWK